MNMVHVEDVADGILLALDKGGPAGVRPRGADHDDARDDRTVAEVGGRKPPAARSPPGCSS